MMEKSFVTVPRLASSLLGIIVKTFVLEFVLVLNFEGPRSGFDIAFMLQDDNADGYYHIISTMSLDRKDGDAFDKNIAFTLQDDSADGQYCISTVSFDKNIAFTLQDDSAYGHYIDTMNFDKRDGYAFDKSIASMLQDDNADGRCTISFGKKDDDASDKNIAFMLQDDTMSFGKKDDDASDENIAFMLQDEDVDGHCMQCKGDENSRAVGPHLKLDDIADGPFYHPDDNDIAFMLQYIGDGPYDSHIVTGRLEFLPSQSRRRMTTMLRTPGRARCRPPNHHHSEEAGAVLWRGKHHHFELWLSGCSE